MTSSPRILVLAGVNGAGKSSLLGALLRERNLDYYNPDEESRRLRESDPDLDLATANSLAWQAGRAALERAIAERRSHAFETTLAGRTIASLLREAATSGMRLLVWYVGLATPDLHVARVRARVERGGHAIPEQTIRDRWDRSRANLIALLPVVAALRLFDNSRERDPHAGEVPEPRLLLHFESGRILAPVREALADTPAWARPVVATALHLALNSDPSSTSGRVP